jgi:hypothetical protein
MVEVQAGAALFPLQRHARAGESELHALVVRLFREYGADEDLVDAAAHDVAGRYADARINAFVPTLIEREVRALVRERAIVSATSMA